VTSTCIVSAEIKPGIGLKSGFFHTPLALLHNNSLPGGNSYKYHGNWARSMPCQVVSIDSSQSSIYSQLKCVTDANAISTAERLQRNARWQLQQLQVRRTQLALEVKNLRVKESLGLTNFCNKMRYNWWMDVHYDSVVSRCQHVMLHTMYTGCMGQIKRGQ